MKLNREELVETLKKLGPAIKSDAKLVECRHIWFTGSHACAFDGVLGIRVKLATDFECGALGMAAIGVLGGFGSKLVTIGVGKSSLDISAGSARASLPIMDLGSNPWPFDRQKPKFFFKLSEAFIDGLKKVQLIKPLNNPESIVQSGIAVYPDGAVANLYSTDSRALVQIGVNDKLPDGDNTKAPGMWGVVLPHPFAKQLAELGEPGAKFAYARDSIVVDLPGGTQLCSSLLDNTGIKDIPSQVTKLVGGVKKKLVLPELEGSMARASALAGTDNEESFIQLSVEGLQLSLDGKLQYGELHERLALQSSGSGSISVRLDHLKALSKEAKHFAITDEALVMLGDAGSVFLMAARD